MTIIKRLIAATAYSLQGLKALFHSEFAFRLELVGMCIAIPIIIWLDVEFTIKLILLVLLGLLLIIETINSAIEAAINRISLESHPISKKAKDMGSAAVFLTIILNAAAWILVLLFS